MDSSVPTISKSALVQGAAQHCNLAYLIVPGRTTFRLQLTKL